MPIQNLASVARLTDALSRAGTLAEVYDASLDALRDGLGVDRASVLLFDEKGVMSFVAWRGLSDAYRQRFNGHTPWRPDTPTAVPICVTDVETDDSLAGYLDAFQSEGIRALGFFPLNHRGFVIGKFMLYYAERHEFSDSEIELARTVAGQVAFGVARVRAEEDLERERRRLADIISSVPGVFWEITGRPDADQRVTFVSEQVEGLLGYSVEEWMNEPKFWRNVIVSDGTPEIEQRMLESRVGEPNTAHYRMRTRDGRLIWTEVRWILEHDDGRPVMRGLTTDVTAQKQAETRAALLNSVSEILGSSLDSTSTVRAVETAVVSSGFADWCALDLEERGQLRRIAVVHRDENCLAAAERLRMQLQQEAPGSLNRRVLVSGVPELVRKGRDVVANLPPDVAATINELGLDSFMIVPLRGGGPVHGTLVFVSNDPAAPFNSEDLKCAVEIGRRAGYAIENARLYEEAQAANLAKDDFLATLSHELRTPMTAILGWAALLRAGSLPAPVQQQAIEAIERSTHAQAGLIDDILDVSRIVTGKFQVSQGLLDVATVVQSAVDTIRPAIDRKRLRLHLHVAHDLPRITGDATRLQQVIWNLLSNAVKFTEPEGEVTLSVAPMAGEIRITVSDSGCGIPVDFLPYVFDRFRQVDSSTTRAHGGLGLGLAIVKTIVEMHGGSVTARSDGEGRGATFCVILPAAGAAAGIDDGAAAGAPPQTLSGLTVLLVEDDDDTRSMLAATLRHFGASVIAVSSARAALEAAARSVPHVVVSDIGMPDQDGYSLIRSIRSEQRRELRDVPAIALTAYARPDEKEKIMASGFGYHLAKPVDPLLVVRTIEQATRPTDSP